MLACQVSAVRSMLTSRTKPVKASSSAHHRTNKPSFMGASAHHWRSRSAASDPYVPSWSPPLAQLASKHRAAVIPLGGQQGSLDQARPPHEWWSNSIRAVEWLAPTCGKPLMTPREGSPSRCSLATLIRGLKGYWAVIPILSKADSLGIPKSPAT